MQSDTVPHWTSDLVSFNNATLQLLQKDLNVSSSGDVCIFGGISTGGKWAWLARNSNLEIIDTNTGSRTSAFCFGHSTGTTDVTITCVKEYEYKGSSKLAVGLRTNSNEGMLCIYDPRVSRVVMAVAIPHVVTAIEPVTSCGGVNAPNFALSKHLCCFFGIVAVGTKGGHIFLVDLCLDEDDYSDEMTARQIKVVTPRSLDVELLREKLVAKGDHLGEEINSHCHTFRSFNYDMPSGMTVKSLYPSEVSVTAMKYISQIGSLAVGFSFGGFQIWKLSVPLLEYSSPLTQQAFPVTHFAYQEPEDDPQYFCYLWVGRGPLATDSSQDVPTSLHLFQLSYDAKEVIPRHGHIYRDLAGCVPRFQYDLTGDTSQKDLRSDGCRLITCSTLAKDVAPGTKHEDSMMEEEDNRQDLSLAAFVWEAPSDPADAQTGSSCFLGLFDLNRWYHAQMPLVVSTKDTQRSCSYLAFCSLDSVMEAAAPDVLLDLHVDAAHISRYLSTISPAPEQHFHPSALSFDTTSLMETGIVTATFLGAQHQVLGDIAQVGPPILKEPQTFYNRCWASGLLVKRQVLDRGLANLTPQAQRETLLSIALDHNLIGFLIDCISNFTLGDFVSGCNLRTILDWAWKKVASIKQSVDVLCIHLYDGFGTTIDDQTMKELDQHAVQMGHMITIFQSLLDQSGTTTEQGLRDLETKYGVVTLICQHLQVVLWFVKTGLLPECNDDMGDTLEGQFCYPAKRLRGVYAQRRAQLQKLCRNNGNGDILMIDGLVSQVGDTLTNLWAGKDNGGSGLYPPPSFHAMLDMYLLENVPLATKHSIVGYFLLDIIFTLSDVKYDEMAKKIELFYQCFSLPLGIVKMLQGFWYLDHKDFEQAIEILVDPAVHTYVDASPWQHRNVIRAFLYYNESKRALQYIRTARPPLLNPEDVELHLTVLLANRLTGEAFEFQRQHRDVTTSDDLLHQLFLGSQQTKTMDELLKLPFDEEEEAALVKYLQDSTEPNSQELLVMHYLQRGRYVEAIRANEHLKQHSLMDIGSDPQYRERTCARNVIVDSYSKLLPGIQRKLAFGPETSKNRTKLIRREVVKPKPLSSVINPAKTSKVISHALLVNAVLDRIAEAHVKLREDETPTKAWPGTADVEDSPPMEPFIGTPITPRTRTARLSTSVVYPAAQAANDSMGAYQASPARPVSFMAAQTSVNIPTPLSLTDRYRRPPIDYSGAEALSLLQTPTITKRRTPTAKPKTETPVPPTPQSILKVRKVARRSPGPSPVNQTATLRLKPGQSKGISLADMPMPSPPIFHKKQLSFAADVSGVKEEKKKSSTPVKRITFADETFGKAPSPEPRTTIHYPAEQHASPRTPSPVKMTTSSPSPVSPQMQSHSPPRRSPSPSKRSPSPQSKEPVFMPPVSVSPPREVSPPRGRSPPPGSVSPPRERSPPPGSVSPPREVTPPREKSPPPASVSPPRELTPPREQSPPMDISPSKEASPPRGTSPPRDTSPPMDTAPSRGTTPPKGTSPPRDISPAKDTAEPMDVPQRRDTPTPPFVSPASSPPRLSDSPTKQVSFAPIPTSQSSFSQVTASLREPSPDPRSESPSDDMFEPAVAEQMVVDDEITFNLTKREEEMEEEAEPVTVPSRDVTDAPKTAEKEDDDRLVSYVPSPRPPIHPLSQTSTSSPWQPSSLSTPPRAEEQVLQSFPTPPTTSRDPAVDLPPSTSVMASQAESDMPPPPQRLSMPSTFAPAAPVDPAMTRSFGVSPFLGSGAFGVQEGVQTSPMTQSLFGLPTMTTEMAAQTTPGLALRSEGGPSRPRMSFAASLQSSHTLPPSDGEIKGEGTDQEMGITRDFSAIPTPGSHLVTVKQEPLDQLEERRGDIPTDDSQIDGTPSKVKSEPDEPEAPSFIFSPPQTRSRARRQAHRSLSEVTTPAFDSASKSSFHMPTMGPTPSELLGKAAHSSTPKRGRPSSASSREGTPTPSISVGSTPTSVTKTATPLRRSPRIRKREVKSESTPEVAGTTALSTRRGRTASAAGATDGRVTRSRKSHLLPEPSDSPVLLVSPVEPPSQQATSRRGPRKVVRPSHTMTLRTPKKPTRNVKLW